MMKNLSKVKGIFWDFDGVFYEYDTVPNYGFYELCDKANAMAAYKIIVGLDYDTALNLAAESYKKYNDPITGFVPLAKEYGVSEKFLKDNIFYIYHSTLFDLTVQEHPHLLKVPESTLEKFEKLGDKVTNVILSHSAVDDWLKPAITNMKLDKFFKEENIIGLENFEFKSKSESPAGITMAVEKLGMHTSEIVFIEDTLKNIQVAKQAYPDLITVFKTNKTEKPEGVDILVKSQNEFLDMVINSKMERKPKPISPRPSLNGR